MPFEARGSDEFLRHGDGVDNGQIFDLALVGDFVGDPLNASAIAWLPIEARIPVKLF